jgi:hypothetical protein
MAKIEDEQKKNSEQADKLNSVADRKSSVSSDENVDIDMLKS